MPTIYPLVSTQPVAKFFYKGTHSHPVRRTVVITDTTDQLFIGYELREGKVVRPLKKAPIKSYRKDQIARIGDIDRRRKLRAITPKTNQEATTLSRNTLEQLIREGV